MTSLLRLRALLELPDDGAAVDPDPKYHRALGQLCHDGLAERVDERRYRLAREGIETQRDFTMWPRSAFPRGEATVRRFKNISENDADPIEAALRREGLL